MAAQQTELNQYFSAIKMALMEYASNVLYIKNINRSIAQPKDQKFIIKTSTSIENLHQSLLNYLVQWFPESHDALTKPLLSCTPSITEIHLNHYLHVLVHSSRTLTTDELAVTRYLVMRLVQGRPVWQSMLLG